MVQGLFGYAVNFWMVPMAVVGYNPLIRSARLNGQFLVDKTVDLIRSRPNDTNTIHQI